MCDFKIMRRTIQGLIDFILDNVKDPNSFEVQKRLNQIEALYWEAFNDYKGK